MKHVTLSLTLLAASWGLCDAQKPTPAAPRGERSVLIEQRRAPQPQLALPCRVVEVVDGDTVRVEIKIQASVRMLDCWAPETRGGERQAGEASRDHLTAAAQGRDALLTIPLGGAARLDDLFTFGRVLGRVSVDGQDLSKLQVESGHATRQKGPAE